MRGRKKMHKRIVLKHFDKVVETFGVTVDDDGVRKTYLSGKPTEKVISNSEIIKEVDKFLKDK